MRKIVSVGLLLALLGFTLYSVSFFTKTTQMEYALYRANNVLEELVANPQTVSRRQQQTLLTAAINDLEIRSMTPISIVRKYQLKAKLFYSLSQLEVWPVKREQYLKRAIYNNYSLLNINHYDLQSWLFQLQLQYKLGGSDEVSEQKLFWSLANVIALGEWNYDALRYASFYCVLKWKKMPMVLKQDCSITLNHLWSDDVQKRKTLHQLISIYGFEDIVQEIRRGVEEMEQ